jgi:NAD(P)-dependent dehydrogenase (short-subunit alcohol dehydrogenase family)
MAAARSVAEGLQEAGLNAKPAELDVTNEASIRELFYSVKKLGRLDILINNAGIAHKLAPVQELDPKIWRDVIDTNLNSVFLCTHYALPLMGEGGSIVNNLSVAAQGMFPGHSAYNTSKWGGLGFTNTLREELRPRRIRVIALIPGPTDTEIWEQFMPEAAHSSKMMSPESVAQAVVNCLMLPEKAVVEEIKIRPITGTI